ncbi:MAG: topoisomerase I [Satyrvirus sp.]|uniref:Topoisomerase I n=1 Tax=Satyrvirus sp. TaxID=2487771 RepID=A0A3G5AHC3_9VIRU|nr:MAG: topoisomerase I [Satyrvirus sp.]
MLQSGEFGLYIIYDKENFSLGQDIKKDISLDEAIKVIEDKKANNIAEFDITKNGKKLKATILNGKFGPYIQIKDQNKKKTNYPIPKDIDPTKLTEEKILEIISKKKTFKKTNTSTGTGGKPSSKARKVAKPTKAAKPSKVAKPSKPKKKN